MKTKYLLLAGLVVVLGSCSTAYRSGQTPDDVYYSPAPEAQGTYVAANTSRDRQTYAYRNSEEREIRRAIRDPRYRNSMSISMGYGFSPYAFGYRGLHSPFYDPFYSPYAYKGFYDPFWSSPYYSYNPYFGFNSFYYGNYWNPYYGGHFGSYYPPAYYPGVKPGRVNTNVGPRTYNLGAYRSSAGSPGRSAVRPSATSAPVRTFGNRNTNTPGTQRSSNSTIRRVFTPSQNSNRSSNQRRYTPSSNSREDYRPVNTTPTRTFERSSTPPVRSVTPPASNSSTPVRTFRKN